jgi:AcrR family transcriptional regulator
MSSRIDTSTSRRGPRPKTPGTRPGRPGGRRDRNRRERATRLCEAALALFLERGLDPTTIDEVTGAAGMAKGSFYRYYDSKAHLVESLCAPVQAEVEAVFANADAALKTAGRRDAVRAAYVALGEALVEALVPRLDLVQLYLQENRGPRTEARAPIRALADVVTRGAIDLTATAQAHGLLRPFPPAISALTVVGAVERLLHAALADGLIDDLTDVPEQVTSLVLEGLRPRRPGASVWRTP